MSDPISINGVYMDAPCPQCKGGKRLGATPFGGKPCNACAGIGHLPTEEGKLLLKFITRYVRINIDPGDDSQNQGETP